MKYLKKALVKILCIKLFFAIIVSFATLVNVFFILPKNLT